MTVPTNNSDRPDWDACPAGELQGLGDRLRREASARSAKRLSGGAVGAAVVIAGFVLAWPWLFSPGGISCEACVDQFPAYAAYLTGAAEAVDGQPEAAPDATLERVRQHLAHCDSCRGAFEARYPGVLGVKAAAAGVAAVWLLAFGRAPRPSS